MDDLQKSKMRSISYWFVDGISEIGTGLVITLMGTLFLILYILPSASKWNWVIAYGQPVIIVAAFFVISKLVKFFKERVTFPRTGYVSYMRPKVNQRIKRGVLAGSTAAAVSIVTTLISGKLDPRFTPLFISALMALAMTVFAFNYGIKRFYFVALVTLATGALLCWLNVSDALSSAIVFIGTGGSMILAGLGVLFHYLRTTQPASAEELE